MRKPSLVLLGLSTLLALSQSTWAWNDTGHKTIAAIAWDDLKPAVRTRVTDLIKKHPQYADYLEDAKAPTPEAGARTSFLITATWPDIVRNPVGKNRLYHHGPWHYVDFPFVIGKLPEGTPAPEDPVSDWKPGTDPANALQALQKCVAELKDPAVPDDQKAVALAWVMHLVGDIQQPLHAVSMYSADYPTGDKGGNSQMVNAASSVMNLHSFWDGLLGRYTDEKIILEIAAKVHQDFPRDTLKDQIKPGDFKAWAMESFAEAKEVTYQNGKLASVPSDKLKADKATPVPELSKEYLDAAKALARKKMALGGYRLADCLNAALGADAATAPAPK